eukprot:g3143.t1
MGVPKFYRWLAERYPLISQPVANASAMPEFDYLYLDMNGIIHNCTHPKDEEISESLTERQIMLGIFSYIDRLVKIIKPTQMLYMAIDGCAPRAKLNQQRSRRFRSAKDAKALLEEKKAKGELVNVKAIFDSNCITPGTPFMHRLDKHLHYFIRKKMKDDPIWQRMKVLYSGHDTPGEGEHKIMAYIRAMKSRPDYNPNLRHCLYGLDADLIMLGLATHEPHFALLREEIDFTSFRRNKNSTKKTLKQTKEVKWQLLSIGVLREYLDLEWRPESPEHLYDQERIIDDFVFMCMLCGNDFVPHLPTLDIGEGAIEFLIQTHKSMLETLDGYLVDGPNINYSRLEWILGHLARKEEMIFEQRAALEDKMMAKSRRLTETQLNNMREERFIQQKLGEELGNQNSARGRYYLGKFGIRGENTEVHRTLCREYVRGLAWVLRYYYHGCPAWGWFYPFHYAPLASDLTNLEQLSGVDDFELGEPYKPFEQLLGCLPPASANFLPPSWQFLMLNANSPIADLYPTDFKIDMNGKRNPWEGVNLLPFTNESRIMSAIEEFSLREKLTPEEKLRNRQSNPWLYTYDPMCLDDYPSSFGANSKVAGFPNLHNVSSRRENLSDSDHEVLEGTFAQKAMVLPGCVIPYPGFPTLHSMQLQYPSVLKPIRINLFGFASRKATLVLVPDPPAAQPRSAIANLRDALLRGNVTDANEAASNLIGVSVFAGYPLAREALVTEVWCGTMKWTVASKSQKMRNGLKAKATALSSQQRQFFEREVESRRQLWLIGREKTVGFGGFDITKSAAKSSVLLKVCYFQGMVVSSEDGSRRKSFAPVEDAEMVLGEVVQLSTLAPDPRFQERGPLSVEERFPLETPIMSVGSIHYGMTGIVTGYKGEDAVEVRLKVPPREPPFGVRIHAALKDAYVPLSDAAKQLRIRPDVLGKISSSVLVKPGQFDIGLNFKVGRKLALEGYCRSGVALSQLSQVEAWRGKMDTLNRLQSAGAQWQLSKRALAAIAAYRAQFPELFLALSTVSHRNEYSISSLFGGGSAGKKKFEEVCKWLQKQPTFALPLSPITSVAMATDAVRAVERAEEALASQAESRTETITAELQSFEILKPVVDSWCLQSKTDSLITLSDGRAARMPALGERVVNARSVAVPFGLRGIVVAIHPSTGCVEVVFDRTFIGGKTLSGLCSNGRGCLMKWQKLRSLSEPDMQGKNTFVRVQSVAKEKKTNVVEIKGKLSPKKRRELKEQRQREKNAAVTKAKKKAWGDNGKASSPKAKGKVLLNILQTGAGKQPSGAPEMLDADGSAFLASLQAKGKKKSWKERKAEKEKQKKSVPSIDTEDVSPRPNAPASPRIREAAAAAAQRQRSPSEVSAGEDTNSKREALTWQQKMPSTTNPTSQVNTEMSKGLWAALGKSGAPTMKMNDKPAATATVVLDEGQFPELGTSTPETNTTQAPRKNSDGKLVNGGKVSRKKLNQKQRREKSAEQRKILLKEQEETQKNQEAAATNGMKNVPTPAPGSLPVHLQHLYAMGWRPGMPLPQAGPFMPPPMGGIPPRPQQQQRPQRGRSAPRPIFAGVPGYQGIGGIMGTYAASHMPQMVPMPQAPVQTGGSEAGALLKQMDKAFDEQVEKATAAASTTTRSLNVWMLEELNLKYDHILALPRTKEARAVNPFGKVPTLVDGDFIIYESAAINTYLGDKYRSSNLVPEAGTQLRGRYDQLTMTLMSELDAQALWIHRLHSLGRLSGDSSLNFAKSQFKRTIDVLVHEMKATTGPYLLGSKFSACDILFVHCLNWAESNKWGEIWTENKDDDEGMKMLQEYLKLCRDREAYKRVIVKWKSEQ